MNESLVLEILNITQQLVETQSQQSANYLWYIIASIAMSAIIYVAFLLPSMIKTIHFQIKTKRMMKKLKAHTRRHLIILAHKESGLFGSMITMKDVIKVERLIRKYGDKGIDLIINTFGGDLLASIRLANLIKAHNIRVIVPKYAWSGGALATIAAPVILMSASATLSPVDPQLGTILKIYSAKYWEEIIKRKGKKANDESIALARMSKEIMKEMKNCLKKLRPRAGKKFYDMFLLGKFTHANQITPKDAKRVGLNVQKLDTELPAKIIETLLKDGVFGI